MSIETLLHKIKSQIGSNGISGWPVAVRDRIHFPRTEDNRVTTAGVAVTWLWTERQSVLPFLEKDGLALGANFYTPAGLQGMVRNIRGNPFINKVVLFGNEYSSQREGTVGEMTSANAIRAFFTRGVNSQRGIDGFGNSVCFDKNIPLEDLNEIREKVRLIDLNVQMPAATLEEKIQEANKIISSKNIVSPWSEPRTYDYEKLGGSFPYEGGPLIVHGGTIPDSWLKMVCAIDRFGVLNLMNAGTDREVKEVNNMVVTIHDPQNQDLNVNPFLVPLTPERIKAYQAEILSSIKPEGKAYTYGNELRSYPLHSSHFGFLNDPKVTFEFGRDLARKNLTANGELVEVDQVKDIVDVLKKDPYSKAAVAITWHPECELTRKHKSSPCWVLMQPLVQGDRLHLTAFFRSHDMIQGWPDNAYGTAVVQKEISDGIGVEPGLVSIISGSAQIYGNYVSQVRKVIDANKRGSSGCWDARGNYLFSIEGGRIVATLIHPVTGVQLEKIIGGSSREVCDAISSRGDLLTSHAMYVGRELEKVEKCLREGRPYKQE